MARITRAEPGHSDDQRYCRRIDLLGILARREVVRARQRATTCGNEKVAAVDCANLERIECPACKNVIDVEWWADLLEERFEAGFMTAQVRTQGRWVGGRVPYGYRLIDAGPHPNKADARWGRRLQKLDPDPGTASVVTWMFQMRLDNHTVARITRALNETAIPCPSAADPERNQHRNGAGWTVRTVEEILANPVYTGRMVWNRQRTDRVLCDLDNPGLGHLRLDRLPQPPPPPQPGRATRTDHLRGRTSSQQ